MTLAQRFWSKVCVRGADDCWLWTATKLYSGYGQIRVGKSARLAHRVSYEIKHGPVPDGLCILHSCDTPACVNPAHLHIGTQLQNLAEMEERGRKARGEGCSFAKLTEQDVLAIRADARLQREIATDFGVNRRTISHIKHGTTWAHL